MQIESSDGARPPSAAAQPRRRSLDPRRHHPAQRGPDPPRHARGRRLLRHAPQGRVRRRSATSRRRRKPIDVVTLENEIEKQGKLDAIGGIAFLGELALRVPTADNVVAYAEIVSDKHQARKLMLASSEIARAGLRGRPRGPRLPRRRRGQDLRGHAAQGQVAAPSRSRAWSRRCSARSTSASSRRDGITGVPTGFADLDSKTAGLQPTELIILAARPAMGKTSFAMSLAQNAATSRRLAVPRVLARDVVDPARRAHAVLRGARRLVRAAPRPAPAPGHDEPDLRRGHAVEGADPDRRHAGALAARAARARPPVPLEQGAVRATRSSA